MYEKSIKKLQQEIEITKADEASRSRGIVKVCLKFSLVAIYFTQPLFKLPKTSHISSFLCHCVF